MDDGFEKLLLFDSILGNSMSISKEDFSDIDVKLLNCNSSEE